MIILHSQHDKVSRNFVEKYAHGHTVVSYPECVESYPNVSAFPSVVINIPSYHVPEQIIPEYRTDVWTDEEGVKHPAEFFEEQRIPAHNTEATIEIMRLPETMQEVLEYQLAMDQKALDNPPVV